MPKNSHSQARLIALLLVIVTALSFWPVRSNNFLLYDDAQHVYHNPYLEKLSVPRVWYFWRYPFDPSPLAEVPPEASQEPPPYHDIYTPLTFTYFALLLPLAQLPQATIDAAGLRCWLDPSIYHAFQFALHLANVLLLFFLLRRLTSHSIGAAFGALLFAINPIQAESVCRISVTNNVLSTSFALLSLIFYLKILPEPAPHNRERSDNASATFASSSSDGLRGINRLQTIRDYGLAYVFFLLALLSKPSAAVLPLILGCLEWGWVRPISLRRTIVLGGWLIPAVLLVRVNQNMGATPIDPLILEPWPLRGFLFGHAAAFYLTKLVLPWPLGIDYGYRPDIVLGQWWGYAAGMLPVGLWGALGWASANSRVNPSWRQTWRRCFAGFLFFLIALLPTGGLVPFYFQAYSVVADRYAYFALVGLSLCLATIIAGAQELLGLPPTHALSRRIARLKMAALGAFAALALLYSFECNVQSHAWHDDGTIFGQSVLTNPSSSFCYYGLASYYQYSDPVLAAENYRNAIRLKPTWNPPHLGLASAEMHLGNWEAAKAEFLISLKTNPAEVSSLAGMGTVLNAQGHFSQAAPWFERASTVSPRQPGLLAQWGVALCKAGRPAEAIERFEEAAQYGQDPVKNRIDMAMAFCALGQFREAATLLEPVLEADRSQFLALFYMGQANQGLAQYDLALQNYREALQLNPDAPEARDIRQRLKSMAPK